MSSGLAHTCIVCTALCSQVWQEEMQICEFCGNGAVEGTDTGSLKENGGRSHRGFMSTPEQRGVSRWCSRHGLELEENWIGCFLVM